VSSGTGARRVKIIEVSATFDLFGLVKMLLPAYSATPTSYLPTANKTSFVTVIVEVRSFTVWKPSTLIKIVRSWGKQTIRILEAAEFFNCMVAQYHACSTHCKVRIREMHTPVSTLAFVFYAMDEMLLEMVSQNLDEMIGFDLLLLTYCHRYIQVFKVKQQQHKPDPSLITKKLRRKHNVTIPFSQ
jgi:hypothetical protein